MLTNTKCIFLFLSVFITLLLTGCQAVVEPELIVTRLDNSLPNYLGWIYPNSQAQLSYEDFIEGLDSTGFSKTQQLCFQFRAEDVLEESDEGLEYSDFATWVSIRINDQDVSATRSVIDSMGQVGGEYIRDSITNEWQAIKIPNGIGPFTMCYSDVMTYVVKGKNVVEFSVEHPKGKKYMYSWSFTILD